MQLIKSVAGIGIFVASSWLVMAAESTTFSVEDFNKIQQISEPELSPNGANVVYSLSHNNLKLDASVSDIWVIPYAGGKAVNLTNTNDKSEWSPKYSPDGKTIAFLGEGKDKGITQLFVMNTNGSDIQQVTKLSDGIINFNWSTDNKQIVFTAFRGGAEPNSAGTKAPIVIDRFQFKEDGVGYLAGARRQLHIVNVKTQQVEQITTEDIDHWLPSWSPDGKWIAFVAKDGQYADRTMDSDIFIMPPMAGAPKTRISKSQITDADPYWVSPPAWSPDSKKLAWLASDESKWIYYAPNQLEVADISTGEIQDLAHIDRNFYSPKWSVDGKSIYSLIELNRITHLAKIAVNSGDITYLQQGSNFSLDFDVSANGHAVVQQSDDNTPFELVALEAKPRAITTHNDWLKAYQLANTQPFDFNNDGHNISGFIVYPNNYDKSKSYPAIFRLHGGPVYQFSHEFMDDWQIYAAQGYIVVGINPRGSSGKGFDFAKAIYADWGNVDVQDILAGADYLTAKGIIDPNRLAVGGWSYGGMLTNYVIATDSRFKAAISGAGTANILGTYGYDQYSREYEYELGTPWENMDIYQRVSFPFLHPQKITTATLYQCSEMDFNVPCIGAEQMYQALRSLHVPTQLVIYPGQHHGIVVPSYLADRMQRNLDWYDSFLKGSR
jgi:dipeptidyl aminopeptidase/acylaminoacyl peptidase